MEIPLYQLFYSGQEPPELPHLPYRKTADEIASASSPEEIRFLRRMARLLEGLSENDRCLLLSVARRMAGR